MGETEIYHFAFKKYFSRSEVGNYVRIVKY